MSARRLRPGGRLDRYVLRLFALSYLAAFFLVVGLFFILDMATNLDDFLEPGPEGETPVGDVIEYYLLQLPFLYLQVSPFVTLVAGLFAGVRMSKANEVVAALGAGVSTRRVFAPLFLGAGLLAVGMFGMREWASESLGQRRDVLHDRLAEGRPAPVFETFWVRDRQGRDVLVRAFHPGKKDGGTGPARMEGVSRPTFGANQEPEQFAAAKAVWVEQEGGWLLEGARLVERTGERKTSQVLEGVHDLGLTPADVLLAWKGREQPLERSFSECLTLLSREPRNARYRTLFHYHLSFPLAGLVLLSVGLPFVVGQERGRATERIAIGLGLCVVYFALEFVSRTLGMSGHLGPILASWLPILFFGSLGTVLFGSMRS